MTDAELIARLRDEYVAASRTEVADRIEVLITERDEAFGEWDKAIVLAEKAAALMNEMDTRRIAAEAKLAKAVGVLEDLVRDCEADYPPSHGAIKYFCRATLAEIKGESHE